MSEQADTNKKPRLVLVAEDDLDTQLIVSDCIKIAGFETVVASDGLEAQRRFQESQPDVVVLDIMMPGMAGDAVCRWIRSLNLAVHVPVLMLTARSELRDKISALDGGADDYLTKPFHYEELQARVRALMRVRELSLLLNQKNVELQQMQARLVATERQQVVGQLAGSTAHQLGQPLSAILLNCHLLKVLPESDARWKGALAAIESDAKRMTELVERLRHADANNTEAYHDSTRILSLESTGPNKQKV